MAKPKIGIIVGSTRPNRFADKPTEWIAKIARARGDIDVEVLDLRDYPLPFFNEAVSPAWGPSGPGGAGRTAWPKPWPRGPRRPARSTARPAITSLTAPAAPAWCRRTRSATGSRGGRPAA